jgi:hypothetical protein
MVALAALQNIKTTIMKICSSKVKKMNNDTSSEHGFLPKRPFLAIANLCFE